MMSRSLEKPRETAMREGRLSTRATATRRMSTLALALMLFLLVSSGLSWQPQMVSSAPTPQQNDVVASAGRKDDGSLILNGTHQLRDGEPAEPANISDRDQRQIPIGYNQPLAMMDNINEMFSTLLDDSSSSTGSRAITPRSDDPVMEDERNLVFNMVIQKERTEKSAFIAPDVNWLRDLVPKVVDVVDKPETTIKEIISNAVNEDIQAEPMRDRQLFVNVVKSQIGSENDVPKILASLADLMKTGGPDVESKLLESRNIGEPQTRFYVINIIIFNLVVLEAPVNRPVLVTDKVSHIEADITEDSYIVALKESQKNRFGSPGSVSSGRINQSPAVSSQQHPRTPDKDLEEDSYIVALKESQKDRFKGSPPVSAGHHHHHHHAIDKVATNQQQLGGQFFTAVPTYEYVSTARPLMAMEKDYLRRQTLKPAQQQLAEAVDEEEPLADEEEQLYDQQQSASEQQQQQTTQSTVVDPYGSLEFVNLPTGPYFTKPNYAQIVNTETTTSSIEKPPEIEAVVADVSVTGGVGSHQVVTTTTTTKPVVNKKPLIVRVPEAMGVMTNKATNVVRNRIRTVGMLGIPMMVGLAGTVNSWLPAVAALGRRRRRRSITEEEEEDWNNREMSSDDDVRSRTLGNAQILARLMGKGAESLLNNWKNREQSTRNSAIDLPGSQSTSDANNSAKKRRPLWFRRRPSVKKSRTSKKMRNFLSTSRKYVTPLIYATLFGNEKADADDRNSAADDDVMEHREDAETRQEAVVEYDLEQQEALENETVELSIDSPPIDEERPEEKEMEEEIPDSADGPSFLSQSGSDFDIVSNFVRAMMMNHKKENEDDLAENREEIFWVKEASIVNTTQTVNHKPNKPGHSGSSLLLLKPGVWVPSSGITNKNVSLFSATNSAVKKPSWSNNNNHENVTNSPITYVSIKSPTKVTWLGVGPADLITSTSTSSSAEYDDPVEVMDTLDLPPSEIVGAPLEFYDEETDNYVSKEVPSLPGQPTVPYYITDRTPPSTAEPPALPLDDPVDMPQPVRPIVMRPTDLRPGLSSLLLTIASFNRPKLPPPIDVSSSVSSQDQEMVTPPNEEFRDDTTNKYTHGHGIVTPSDDTLKYTHGHGIIVTNPPSYDLNQLTAESSLLDSNSFLNLNPLSNLIKVTTGSSQFDDEWNESAESPSLLGDTSIQFVGMYGGTVVNSTNGPLPMIEIPESDGMESSLDDLITQLKANLTTGLMTDRPAGGLHFVNTSTDIVIINPFVTPSSMFPPPQVEAVEAEEGDTFGAIEDDEDNNAIIVDGVAGDQPDSVPVVSNLANLFLGSSGGGSSSSSGSLVTSGGISSGGISGGTVSSTTTNPLALLYTYGLAAIGIFALTLPLWVPFVVGKKRRRTYAPSKTYSASKKKTPTSPKKTYGEPPPNHYKDLSEEEIYGNDADYLDQHQQLATAAHQQIQPQYPTTTIDDYFRPSEELRHSDYSLPKSDDHYMFRDSIALNPQDDMFNNPGPLSSEALYGSPARIFLKARRRRSTRRFRPSNNKRSND